MRIKGNVITLMPPALALLYAIFCYNSTFLKDQKMKKSYIEAWEAALPTPYDTMTASDTPK